MRRTRTVETKAAISLYGGGGGGGGGGGFMFKFPMVTQAWGRVGRGNYRGEESRQMESGGERSPARVSSSAFGSSDVD